MLVPINQGVRFDQAAEWGIFGLMNAANNYSLNPVTVNSDATAVSLTAAQLVSYGVILRTGSPGGGVADTVDTAVNLIAAMGPVLTDGRYSEPLRILNATGQTITVTTNTGITLTGTMTIANGSYRDFLMTVTSPTTVQILNIGGGTV